MAGGMFKTVPSSPVVSRELSPTIVRQGMLHMAGGMRIHSSKLYLAPLLLSHTKLILCFTDPVRSLFHISNKNVNLPNGFYRCQSYHR